MEQTNVKISKLKLAKYNPRNISDEEIEKLKKSIKRFGFVEPVVANKDMTVIGGHQRIRAVKELGEPKELPVIFVDVSKKEEKALNLSLNRISGEWDSEKLFNIINELKTEEELNYTGFDDKEISKILDGNLEEDIENAEMDEEEVKENKSKLGDIYQLGNHRLMCGDSTKIEDIKKLVGDKEIKMIWTDPPYNVNYEATKIGKIKNDNMKVDEFVIFIENVFENMCKIAEAGATFYICTGWQSFSTFENALKINNINISAMIVWVKNRGGIATIDYPHKHEQIIKAKKGKIKGQAILYGFKKGGKRDYYGTHTDYDVWEVDRLDASEYVHPTEKPDWLVMKALKNSTKFRDNVLDLFGGSGSSLMACEKTGRNMFMMEYDPKFIDVIINRWEKYTKSKAIKI